MTAPSPAQVAADQVQTGSAPLSAEAIRERLAWALCPPGFGSYGSGPTCITHARIADRILPEVLKLLAEAEARGSAS